MKHFTRHPSKVTAATDILSFKCPGCKNKTLYSAEQDVHIAADVDENELFICDECGGEFRAHPQYNGSIKFTESIESATSVDDKKIDRRLSSTSKRYKGYRISLDNQHECYNIYDAHGELEDHGFKSVDDAMAHIDELVSIESATDVDEIPEFNDWLYDKYGVGDADMSDDDWEYYHDKYLKETGQEKYMSGNVYSSNQPGVRRKSTHRPVTVTATTRFEQWMMDKYNMTPEQVNKLSDTELDKYAGEFKKSKQADRKKRVAPKGQSYLHDVVNSATDENSSTHVRVILNSGINADGFDVEVWEGNKRVYNESCSYGYNVSYDRAHAEQAQRDVDNAKKYNWSRTPTARPYVADVIQDICNKYGVSVSDVEVIAGKNSFKGQNVDNSDIAEFKRMIMSATDPAADYEDDIQEISQEFTSENTSINSSKLPAIFKMVTFQPGTINIDYGGGRFDNVADYLTQFDVINLVYDPYNRTPEHNKEVIRTVRKAGGADTATCSNVLNVIKEPEVRQNVLQNIKKLVKPNGTVYITVYEGSGKNNEGPTKSGYQLNRKTEGYLDEIKQVFSDAVRKGKLIVAHPNGSAVTSAEDLSYDAFTCEDCTYDLWTLVQDDSGEWVREDKIDTYDDYDTAEAEAEALAKDTPCQLVEVGPDGTALVWTSKTSDSVITEWLHDEYTMGNTKYSELVSELVDNFSLSTDEADQIISDWIDEDEDIHLEYDEDNDVESATAINAGRLADPPQQVVDSLIQILNDHGFVLDPRFEINPGKTWMGNIHLQVIDPDSNLPQDDFEALKDFIDRNMFNEIRKLGKDTNCPITWSFGVDDNGNVTGGLDINQQYIEDEDERAQREMDEYDQSDRDWEHVVESSEDTAIKSKNKICQSTSNKDFFEIETNLRSNSKIKMSSGSWKVDTIYLKYDSSIDDAPHLIGYAHDDDGNYDSDVLTADEIENCDLSAYMDGIDVVDVDGMINDNPKYFYNKFKDGPIKFDENVEGASYGGAYDIEPDQFFTKEEIVEFGNAVADRVSEELEDTNSTFVLSDVYMDTPTLLHVEVTDNNMNYSADVVIDMRRIRKPRDLHKYETDAVTQIEDDYCTQNNIPLDAATHINASENLDSLQTRIFQFLDDCQGYSDYNQKIEDVSDEFGMSPDEAEGYVWDWTLNHDAEWHDTADQEDVSSISSASDVAQPIETSSSKVFELVEYIPDSGENGPDGDKFYVVDWGEFESEEAAEAHWNAQIQDRHHFVREGGDPADYIDEFDESEYPWPEWTHRPDDDDDDDIEEATVLGAEGVDDYPEPPESNEPEERDSKEEIIIELDDDIVVEDDGDSVEFLRDPAFLDDVEEWTPEDEPMFQIDDDDSVYEHVMDLIIDSIPAEDGKYHIKGRLKLVYDVTLSYYYEGTSEEDQTTELDEDGCESIYDKYRSEVIELDVTEI